MNKLFLISLLLSSAVANAQEPEMADAFRSDGKIYVVIAVLAVIFIAIVIFLLFLERKVKRMEDKLNNNEK